MLPNKELNIYPKNDENLKTLLNYYFKEYDFATENSVEILMDKSSLSLNQIDFIARKLSESWSEVFQKHFKQGTSMPNLMRHGIEGLTKNEKDWAFPPHGKSRPMVREFLQFVKDAEVDYKYLESNN